jgi:NADPH-dependent curcumin reductase CurA
MSSAPDPAVSRQWQLVRRPSGEPTPEDFRLVEVALPAVGDGEVRVANEFVSVDPYMRGRMNAGKSYSPPFALAAAMTGGAVGRVVESRADGLAVGDLVTHGQGWRDVAQGPATEFRRVERVPGLPSSVFLGVLGMPGLTAWVGLLVVAEMRPGDTVFVSGAAGAVGSAVGQIARLRGAGRVIGSAGTAAKVALLTERYGFDAAFSYRDAPVADQLATAAPDGIDVYFDNVGGDHLDAALAAFKPGGRTALCGAISTYNAIEPPPGPRNLSQMIGKGLTMKGFLVGSYSQHAPAFTAEVGGWLAAGTMSYDETVVDGIERNVEAFLGLLRGENTGKMLVRVADAPT